ncbi:monoterpene synthase 8, chloroplastic-like [Carex rostrata]
MRPALWELAVLDFNLVQNLYKKELKQVSRWWTDLGLYEKLPFIRDRLVENYLWSLGLASEPEHSSYRIANTQANCLITTMDDIYDVYGSLDELEVFTNAIQQWDVTATEGLPENFCMCILALFNTVEDQGNEVLKEKGLNVIPYLRRAWKDLCKAYIVEARWYHSGFAPTIEEYLENAWVSISAHIALSYAYCINDYVTAKDLEQFSSGGDESLEEKAEDRLRRSFMEIAEEIAEITGEKFHGVASCFLRERERREKEKDSAWGHNTSAAVLGFRSNLSKFSDKKRGEEEVEGRGVDKRRDVSYTGIDDREEMKRLCA